MQHGVGKGLHDVDMFVKSWIQLFCGQNALIVPLWCASEQRISNKTRMTVTFTSYKVNVNLHSIRDLFKMTFKKRNQNKWLWQKMIGKIPKWSELFPLSEKKVTEDINAQTYCPQIMFVDNPQSMKHLKMTAAMSKRNSFPIETCGTDVFHEIFQIRYPNKMRPSSKLVGHIRHMSSLYSCLTLGVHTFCSAIFAP